METELHNNLVIFSSSNKMKLLLLTSLCTLCLHVNGVTEAESQAAVIKEVEKLNDGTVINNSYEQSLHAITTIQNNLNTAVNNAEVQLTNFKSQLDHILYVVKGNDKEKFENIVMEAKNKLNEWKLMGDESKVDITSCLQANQHTLDEIFNRFIKDDIECFDKEYAFEVSKIDDTQKYVNTIVGTFKAFEVEKLLKGCYDMQSLSCINDFNREISKLANSLPADISRKLQEIMVFMNAAPTRLEVCSVKYLNEIPIETQKVVEAVANCAKPLFGTK